MNGNFDEDQLQHASREEIISALFANMVIEHSQMALMLLGRAPNPQGGPPMKDLESAKRFIDELEMLAEKTKGNLNPKEEQLMRQSLGTLRMLFVQELEAQETEGGSEGGGHEFKFAPGPQASGNFAPPPLEEPLYAEPPAPARPPEPAPAAAASASEASPEQPPREAPERPDESRKKFVKKY